MIPDSFEIFAGWGWFAGLTRHPGFTSSTARYRGIGDAAKPVGIAGGGGGTGNAYRRRRPP